MATIDKEYILKEYEDLFRGLGTFEHEYKILLKNDAKPVAHAPRRVPLVLKDRLKKKLDSLVENEIIEIATGYCEWVHHLVTVEKKDKNELRPCIDPRELNANILDEQTYIPTFDDFASKVNGMKYFSVLDLKDGFWHVKLAEESRKLCTFATPFGNYRFLRMPFGIKSGPKVFQRMNEMNFGDIENVLIYFDDIMIMGATKEAHDETLKKVLTRARVKNVRFNVNKMQIASTEVKYVGHIFSLNEIKADPERLRAIREMERPKNKTDLQTFLGVVNFMRSFISNLSEKTTALRALLKKNAIFLWTELHDKVFNDIKDDIMNSNVLIPFELTKEIVIQCDASQSGLGCCLLQSGSPISFASRSLTSAEQNYSQIEKEMMAILFACTKFNFYTYGRRVKIINDHKPLLGIINKEIHKIASAKLQRMRLKLLNYDIELEYAPGKTIQLADYLSRYMIKTENESNEDKSITQAIMSINVSNEKKKEIQVETEKDESLRLIKDYCKNGWPNHKSKCPLMAKYFFRLRNDILLDDDVLFYHDRVIIPKNMRQMILMKLHEPHFGVTKTQQRARSSIFWPNINNDIENIVSYCRVCQDNAPQNRKEPMIAHEIPDIPFQKIACDILEFATKSYLVIIDFYSKWIELIKLKNKTAGEINFQLLKVFASYGIPKIIIADNMPFGSYECRNFAKENDIEIITSSPHYPQSNGLAERAVQICKNILKKSECEENILKSLMAYRSTPTKYMNYSPAQLLQSRNLRTDIPTHIEKLKPKLCVDVDKQHENKQLKAKLYYDETARQRSSFTLKEKVLFRNNNIWQSGVIIGICDEPRSYTIQSFGRNYRRNSKHIRHLFENKNINNTNDENNRSDLESRPKFTRSGRSY